jgi:hypothetical protein
LIATFFFVYLRAKETRDQCATCERSCNPNAKAQHSTERNRPHDAINVYSSDLLKKLQNTKNFAFSPWLSLNFHVFVDETSGAAGAGARGWATRIF